MTDGHAPSPAKLLGLSANFFEIAPRRIEIEVEVKVDVAIEALRDRKHARDVPARIGVCVGTPADQIGPLLAGFNHEFFGAGIVEQSLLRKDANFEIDRPSVIALQSPDRMKAPKPNARVNLHVGAHAHGPLEDRLFQRSATALIDVLLGEGALGRRHRGNRLGERPFARMTTVENARLVEMDVRLDEARNDELAGEVLGASIRIDARSNLDDATSHHADVHGLAISNARTMQDEIRSHEGSGVCAYRRQ